MDVVQEKKKLEQAAFEWAKAEQKRCFDCVLPEGRIEPAALKRLVTANDAHVSLFCGEHRVLCRTYLYAENRVTYSVVWNYHELASGSGSEDLIEFLVRAGTYLYEHPEMKEANPKEGLSRVIRLF